MRYITSIATIAAALFMAMTSLAADAPAGPSSAEEMQKAFEAYATPGKEHAQLKRLAGRWKAAVKSYYENPAEPMTSEGSSTYRLIMGGRFLQERFECKFGDVEFTGQGVTGYDNAKKKYVGVWLDNMGTGMLQLEGNYDPNSHSLVMAGASSSPVGEMKVKTVTKYVSDDEFHFTLYMDMGGPQGERKSLEVAYTRVKATD